MTYIYIQGIAGPNYLIVLHTQKVISGCTNYIDEVNQRQRHFTPEDSYFLYRNGLSQVGLKPAMYCVPHRHSTNLATKATQILMAMQRQRCLSPLKHRATLTQY